MRLHPSADLLPRNSRWQLSATTRLDITIIVEPRISLKGTVQQVNLQKWSVVVNVEVELKTETYIIAVPRRLSNSLALVLGQHSNATSQS